MPSNQHAPSLTSINENACYDLKGHYRLVIMGSANVGKTAIVNQFMYGHFPSDYLATVEELHRAEFDVGSARLVLDILDTSGSYQFPAMRKLAVSTGDAFVLVYAIDDEESFEEVGRLRDMLLEHKPSDVPIVVVGNKSDLVGDRVVQKEVAETIVGIDWECRFVETSAKDNLNVLGIFNEILMQANVPYNLNPGNQKRRTSLPMHYFGKVNSMLANQYKSKQKIKRSSCAVS